MAGNQLQAGYLVDVEVSEGLPGFKTDENWVRTFPSFDAAYKAVFRFDPHAHWIHLRGLRHKKIKKITGQDWHDISINHQYTAATLADWGVDEETVDRVSSELLRGQ